MKGERRMTTEGRKGEREREFIVIIDQTRPFLSITGKI